MCVPPGYVVGSRCTVTFDLAHTTLSLMHGWLAQGTCCTVSRHNTFWPCSSATVLAACLHAVSMLGMCSINGLHTILCCPPPAGWTCLNIASSKGHQHSVQLLVEALPGKLAQYIKRQKSTRTSKVELPAWCAGGVVEDALRSCLYHVSSKHYDGHVLEQVCAAKGWAVQQSKHKTFHAFRQMQTPKPHKQVAMGSKQTERK